MGSKKKNNQPGLLSKFKNRLSEKADGFLNNAKDKINDKVEGIKKPSVGVKLEGGTMLFLTALALLILGSLKGKKSKI